MIGKRSTQSDFGRKVTCTISRNGDLIHRMYLRVELNDVVLKKQSGKVSGFRWVDWLGHALIRNVEVEVGGQRINKSLVSPQKYHAPMVSCAA